MSRLLTCPCYLREPLAAVVVGYISAPSDIIIITLELVGLLLLLTRWW